MLDGVFLTLLIGPLQVPLLAPQPVTEALESVQVTAGRNSTGFQLTFTIGKLTPLQVMLTAGLLNVMTTRVVVIVTYKGVPTVISDGVVTQHQITPSNDPGRSTLTITGEDLSVLMDVLQVNLPYPALPDSAKVTTILAKYAMFGIAPLVIPPIGDSPRSFNEGFDVQTTTDLTYIRGLASNAGYTFYIEPGPVPLTSLAYFGPDERLPVPQPALNVNLDWQTNVESLNFSLSGLSKQTTVVTILDPITKKIPIPIPLPGIDVLKPPLTLKPVAPSKIVFSDDMASLDTAQAIKRTFGLIREGADTVTGNGSLSVMRYGQILRARMYVGVRGAGPSYDGFYYVDSVTHNLKRGEYKQSFTLTRDGTLSLTPVVIP
jgi:hypothetical protein